MKQILFSLIALAAISIGAISCNGSSGSGRTFNDQFRPPVNLGPLKIRYAVSLTDQQVVNANQAIATHWLAFTLNFGTPVGNNLNRDVYVYDLAFLNAPYLANQKGWVDLDKNFRINVVIGACDTVEDMTHQLVHSYYFPYEIYHDTPSKGFWDFVKIVQDDVVLQLKFQRRCSLR